MKTFGKPTANKNIGRPGVQGCTNS